MPPLTFPTSKITPRDPQAQALHGLDCALSDVIDVIQQMTDHEALLRFALALAPLVETAARLQGLCLDRVERKDGTR